MAFNDKTLGDTSVAEDEAQKDFSSSTAALDAISSPQTDEYNPGSFNKIKERYSGQPARKQRVSLPDRFKAKEIEETKSLGPTPASSPLLSPQNAKSNIKTVEIGPESESPPPPSSTSALDKAEKKLNGFGATRGSLLSGLSPDIQNATTSWQAPVVQPIPNTTAVSATTIAVADTLPESTTGALNLLSQEISSTTDPLLDPLNGFAKRPQDNAKALPEEASFSKTVVDLISGETPEEKKKEGEGTESSSKRKDILKDLSQPKSNRFSSIPRPNSVKVYGAAKRNAKAFGRNLKNAVMDNGSDEGDEEEEGQSSPTPYMAPSSGGSRGNRADEQSDGTESTDDETDAESPTGGGAAPTTPSLPTPSSAKKGVGKLKQASAKAKKALSGLKKAKWLVWGKWILLFILLVILLTLILSLLNSTNQTLAKAQGKTAGIFFEYFEITESKPFIQKDGLLKVSEINSLNFEYQLRSQEFYSEILGGSLSDPIIVKDMILEADVCVPLNGLNEPSFKIISDEDIRPDNEKSAQISQASGCVHFTWKANVCDKMCVSDDEKLVTSFKYAQPIPQEAFGNGTRILRARFSGSLQIYSKGSIITMPIEPAPVKCFDVSLGAGTSDYSVSCDSPTNVATAGQSDSSNPNIVDGNTPEGCPFFFDQDNGGKLQCTNGFFIVPNEPLKSHEAVDYQVKDPSGAIRSDFAVKAPVSGIAYVIYNQDISSQCGQGVEIHSPDGKNIYQLFHLDPNSPALQGKVKNDSFEVSASSDLGKYFNPGKGNRYFPDGDSDPKNNKLCWTGPHIHYVHQVNKSPINPFEEIRTICNTDVIKADARCR
jgi:hypothetical protein